jgi:hypothetical protein
MLSWTSIVVVVFGGCVGRPDDAALMVSHQPLIAYLSVVAAFVVAHAVELMP